MMFYFFRYTMDSAIVLETYGNETSHNKMDARTFFGIDSDEQSSQMNQGFSCSGQSTNISTVPQSYAGDSQDSSYEEYSTVFSLSCANNAFYQNEDEKDVHAINNKIDANTFFGIDSEETPSRCSEPSVLDNSSLMNEGFHCEEHDQSVRHQNHTGENPEFTDDEYSSVFSLSRANNGFFEEEDNEYMMEETSLGTSFFFAPIKDMEPNTDLDEDEEEDPLSQGFVQRTVRFKLGDSHESSLV